MSVLEALLALEHAGWRSLCASTGGDFYRRAMTEDALMVLADGSVLDREAVAASLSQAPPWAGYELEAPVLLPLGEHAAALVYTGRAWRDSGDPFAARMASSYVQVDGAWRLALYQQTPLP